MTAAGTPASAFADTTAPATLFDVVAASGAATIAVIGLVKNAGKTTVVNALMDNVPLRFGLTSLGLDGERTDHLTGLDKPRIVPPRGTLIATTVGSLDRSHYTMEQLERLPFHTSLGNVVIGRAVGDRAVEISGPTTLAEVAATAARLHAHGARLVLVDGAINRLGSASPRVSDAVIMATGGLVADSLDGLEGREVVERFGERIGALIEGTVELGVLSQDFLFEQRRQDDSPDAGLVELGGRVDVTRQWRR